MVEARKAPEKIGTVKEVVHQVSHSKKWKSEKALDKNGQPVLNSKGKPVYRTSYSILQDQFFDHMATAGFAPTYSAANAAAPPNT